MVKTIGILVALFGVMIFGAPASALSSFTCTFGDGTPPCQQQKGGVCQHKFAARVFATCGNLSDDFVCMFTRTKQSSAGDKAALLGGSLQRTVGYAFAIAEPGAGKLTLGYRDYSASCDIAP
jgi:hypothetical protein